MSHLSFLATHHFLSRKLIGEKHRIIAGADRRYPYLSGPATHRITHIKIGQFPRDGKLPEGRHLQPIPGQPGTFAYGFIPPRLFTRIKGAFLDLARQGHSAGVRR